MRQTTTGGDHVAYVDLDSSSPGLDRWRGITSLSMGCKHFVWDGRAQTDPAQFPVSGFKFPSVQGVCQNRNMVP
jgi:hypothetical protein